MSQPELLVVGGGLSGLCCALAAARDRNGTRRVRLFEAERCLAGEGGRAEADRAAETPLRAEGDGEDETSKEALRWLEEVLGEELQDSDESSTPVGVEVLRRLTSLVRSHPEVEVLTEALVTRLWSGGCGFERHGEELKAEGPVVLCCGGLLGHRGPGSLLARLRPDLLHLPVATLAGAAGAVLAPAVFALGAAVASGRVALHATAEGRGARGFRARRLLPRRLRNEGRVVSRHGEVTGASEDELAQEMLRQGPCWLVLPGPCARLTRRRVRDLAQEIQVSWKLLVQVFRRPGDEALGEEDFVWAAQVTPALFCFEGGLVVEGSGRVLGQKTSAPLPRLFAAGEAAAVPGKSLLRCVASALAAACGAGQVSPSDEAAPEAIAVPSEAEMCADLPELEVPEPRPGRNMAQKGLESFLKKELTAETLQKSFARALTDGNLAAAAEDLAARLKRSWGLPASRQALSLQPRDPCGLPVQKALAELPEAGRLTQEVPTSCVHCRLPLKLQVTAEVVNGHAPVAPEEEPGGRGNAYATLLYGSGVEYFLGALVLGWSLRAHGCQADRVLLYTQDVPEPFLEALEVFWYLRQVDYLQGCPQLYENYKGSRFQDVFTKLQALSCTDYSQVLMMDLDMLVRGNLDELFELRAPAALKRCSGREQPEHGADFTAEDLWSWQRDKMSSGLNAGVMLLRPDAKVYERMVREIRDPTHPEHLGTFGPEQDYLARFFTTFGRGAWAHLHARFNYQPNLPDDYVGAAHRKLDVIQDVMVAHYSGGRVKPWKLRNLELNAQGVRRLLEDDTLEAEMGGEAPRASRPMVMDGVAVGQRDTGLPANVKAVMWEWILALRRCDQELLEAAVDLLFLIGEAGGR